MPAAVHTDLGPRLEAAGKAVRDAESKLAQERELRRLLVVQAVEEGMAQRQVARHLGGGTGLVHKILAKPDPEDED
jgi:hypothetical protein